MGPNVGMPCAVIGSYRLLKCFPHRSNYQRLCGTQAPRDRVSKGRRNNRQIIENPSASSLTKGSVNGKVGWFVVRRLVQSVAADPGVVKLGRSHLVSAVWVLYLDVFAGAHSPGCDRRADGQGQGVVNLHTLVVELANRDPETSPPLRVVL